MNRVINAARLNIVAPGFSLVLPWAIMASSLVINILIWAVTDVSEVPGAATGGLASLYIALMFVYIQAVASLLPFAMGLSLTRRTFFLGTALFAVVQALVYGIALYALLVIERATNGWGVNLSFFRGFWAVDNPVSQILVLAVPMAVMAFLGIAVGVMYKRFGSVGMYLLTIGLILGVGTAAVLITWQERWIAIGEWFSNQSTTGLAAGWPLLLGVLFAVGGYLGIRRVVP